MVTQGFSNGVPENHQGKQGWVELLRCLGSALETWIQSSVSWGPRTCTHHPPTHPLSGTCWLLQSPGVLLGPEWEVLSQFLQCVGDRGALGPSPDSQAPHYLHHLPHGILYKGSLSVSASRALPDSICKGKFL